MLFYANVFYANLCIVCNANQKFVTEHCDQILIAVPIKDHAILTFVAVILRMYFKSLLFATILLLQ